MNAPCLFGVINIKLILSWVLFDLVCCYPSISTLTLDISCIRAIMILRNQLYVKECWLAQIVRYYIYETISLGT